MKRLLFAACALLLARSAFAADTPDLVQLQQQAVQQESAADTATRKTAQFQSLLETTLTEDLETIRDRLAAKGVKFQDLRPLLESFNSNARYEHNPTLDLVRTNEDGTFATARLWVGDPTGLIAPAGVSGIIRWMVALPATPLEKDNTVSDKCVVRLFIEGYTGHGPDGPVGDYPCKGLMFHGNLDRLTKEFSVWLAAAWADAKEHP